MDMWNNDDCSFETSLNWNELREKIAKYGVYNSLLTAPMPTASTSVIMGNCESFEPQPNNIYNRSILSGEFTVVNEYLRKDLIERGLWTKQIRTKIELNRGSIQNIDEIGDDLKEVYKCVEEVSRKIQIDMAVDRARFIDQSQSFTINMPNANNANVTSMLFYGWRKGLKTGVYYLRTKGKSFATQFTVDTTSLDSSSSSTTTAASTTSSLQQCTRRNATTTTNNTDDTSECMACGS